MLTLKNTFAALYLAALSVAAAGSLAAVEHAWSPAAMLQTKTVSDVQLSPDNKSALFVVTSPSISTEKGSMLSRIYRRSLDGREAEPMTSADASSSQPRWSPDGKWIAFTSNSGGVKNLYLISAAGGEAVPLTQGQRDVQTYSWSPDSTKIALVVADETAEEKGRDKTPLAIIDQQGGLINRLWCLDPFAATPTLQALTPDDYCVRGCGDFGVNNVEFDWSPDGARITFAHSPSTGYDDYHLDSSIATVDVATGAVFPWEKGALYEALPRYSLDGHRIGYMCSDDPHRYSLSRRLAVRNADGTGACLLAPTVNEGVFLTGPNLLGWTKGGDGLLFFEPRGTKYRLTVVPADGSPACDVDTGACFFKEPALSFDKSKVGVVMQTTSTPPEAYLAELDRFAPVQLSSVNVAQRMYSKIRTDLVSWASSDGQQIEGLLTYPVGYTEGRQYPLILMIHGGPMAFFDETFLGTPSIYPLAAFAEAGFFLLRPNPRGSCGYGKAFCCANYNDWGGGDFADLMAGVDAIVAKGLADPERLGVMGWSYGGYMTAWAVTQTSRFKAASLGAGPINLVSMNGTSDLHRFMSDYFGSYEGNRSLYEERSPLNHVLNVTTPCLIQHGIEDKRVPVSQSHEFHRALVRLGKEATLVLYPGMEHRLSDPRVLLESMQRNLAWFQQHLNP